MGDDATEDRCGGWVLRAELDPDGQAGKNFRSSPGQLRRSSPRRPHIYTSESYIRSDPYSCKLASNLQMGDRRLISPGTRPMSDVRRPAFSGRGSTKLTFPPSPQVGRQRRRHLNPVIPSRSCPPPPRQHQTLPRKRRPLLAPRRRRVGQGWAGRRAPRARSISSRVPSPPI